ncbi:MAG: TrkH family potassium uptake protein [Treponemataceae bacterium]|nr:TrkH family potassium uptake protein [Treponemataceae bacterium]
MTVFSIIRVNSMLLAIIAITMFLPAGVSIYYGEFDIFFSFLIPALVAIVAGVFFFFIGRKKHFKLSSKAGFITVATCWLSASLLGSLPFLISGCIPSFTDAFFESVSGYTTTGATILSDVQSLPRAMNLWRAQMHWLGGMGIVALTVALLPLFGVGGFQLIKAETTGPEKGKITPKITQTAKILWFIYFGFTVVQTLLLMLAGMDFIDALIHTFSTLGTGGFSSRNSSVGHYNSVAIDWICTIFMILSGVNFSLYYKLFQGKFKELRENSELKAYLAIIIVATLLITFSIKPLYGSFMNALRYASFQASTIMTTTGFSTADYTQWPPFAQIIIFFLMFIGGCSGSTGGSVKVIRWVILGRQMKNELKRLLHPHGIFGIQLNKHPGRKDVVLNVAGFFYIYFIIVLITSLVAALGNADVITSFTTGLSLVGNIGPGFGKIGPIYNYSFYPAFAKWWFCVAMIAGRLEFYTMIILFMPSFWKK